MPRNRQKFVARVKRLLLRKGFPRLEMAAILGSTGLLGFLASSGLLRAGLTTMWARYLISLAVAYVAFLGLLTIWIRFRDKLWDLLDFPDFFSQPSGSQPQRTGDIEGTGFSPLDLIELDFDKGAGFRPLDLVELDLDDGLLIVLPIVLAIGCLVVSLYVIYIAPIMFAELLVDAFIVAGLYRRLRDADPQHWIYTAVHRTWLPVAGLALVLAAVGFTSQRLVPEAVSIGDVMRTADQPQLESADTPPDAHPPRD